MTAPLRATKAEAGVWPFHWLALYADMAKDVGRCAQALTQCTDAMEAMQAEGLLALRLTQDVARAYADLAATPWTVMASALAQPAHETDMADTDAADVRSSPPEGRVSPARRDPSAR